MLPALGAASAALLARPNVEIRQLLAMAEQARRERPQLWTPYAEAVAEVTRAMKIERGDVGAAVEHARRAVAAAQAGADVLTVGVLASLSQALFFAGDLDEARLIAMQAVERPDAPEVPDGYVASLGLLALVDAEQGRPESARGVGTSGDQFRATRFQTDSWVASLPHLGLALARTATGRLDEAEREALRGERLRRSPHPTVGHAHALLVLAHVCVARSRLERAAGDPRARAEGDRGVSRSGTATRDRGHRRAGPHDRAGERGSRDIVEEPSAAELAVLGCLATGLSRREIGAQLYISLNTVKTHTRELYRKLHVTSRAEAVARAEALGLLDLTESPG